MKPIKCWNCAYLGKCMDYNEKGCVKFTKWKLTFKEVAEMCNLNERTLYKWFASSENKALNNIYDITGYRFKVIYIECRRFLVRDINKEKNDG